MSSEIQNSGDASAQPLRQKHAHAEKKGSTESRNCLLRLINKKALLDRSFQEFQQLIRSEKDPNSFERLGPLLEDISSLSKGSDRLNELPIEESFQEELRTLSTHAQINASKRFAAAKMVSLLEENG